MRTKTTLMAALASALLLTACGSGQEGTLAEPGGDEPIKVRWGVSTTTPGPAQAPYSSLPRVLGYWEEEGLDVEVLGFSGSSAVFQAIDAGQLDVGQGPPSTLFAAVQQGSELVAFYDHVPVNFLVPAVPEDSPIQTIADFEGKTVGVHSMEAGGVPMIRAMAAREAGGADAIDLVVIGTGAPAMQSIQQGRVDAVSLWDSAYAQIEALGQPLRIVSTDFWDQLGFQNAIVTTADNLDSRSEVMVGLARGVAKATAFAHENPEAAVRLHWEVYPDSKPTGVSDEEALAQGVRILEARNEHTQAIHDGVWGASTPSIVEEQMQVLIDSGVLDGPVDPGEVWNGDLIEEINDFDEAAVRETARNHE